MVLPVNLNTKEHVYLSPIYQFIHSCICSACKLFVFLQTLQILNNFHLVAMLDESSVVICLLNLGELGFYSAFWNIDENTDSFQLNLYFYQEK